MKTVFKQENSKLKNELEKVREESKTANKLWTQENAKLKNEMKQIREEKKTSNTAFKQEIIDLKNQLKQIQEEGENKELKKELDKVISERQIAKTELVFTKNEIKELKEEISELKEEIRNMKLKKIDLLTDQHNLTNEPPSPSFYPSMNLMIAGLERFIEHNRQTIVGPYTCLLYTSPSPRDS